MRKKHAPILEALKEKTQISRTHKGWKKFPDRWQAFAATFYVNLSNEKKVQLLINVNPENPLCSLYMFEVTNTEFVEFIEALYKGKDGVLLKQAGAIVTRTLKVTGKCSFNAYSAIGFLPVGFASLTASLTTCKELYEEYCSK